MSNQYDDEDIVACTCGANVISYQMGEHITRVIHNKNFKLKKDDRILDSSITIEDNTFNNCNTCHMYIHSISYNDHLTTNCIHRTISLPPFFLKGRINCVCGQILKNSESYIKHLTSKSHTDRSPRL